MDRSDIRVKAYAVFRRGKEVLFHETREKDGTLIGYRIPGGHVEFGERSYDAICREIEEEIGQPVENVAFLGMGENIFVFQGKHGHEVTFIYTADFKNKDVYQQNIIKGYEHSDDSQFDLLWIDPENPPEGLRIFPGGLIALLN